MRYIVTYSGFTLYEGTDMELRGGGGMTNYAILDIETDTLYGVFSTLTVATEVKHALTSYFANETRFSLIKYDYID